MDISKCSCLIGFRIIAEKKTESIDSELNSYIAILLVIYVYLGESNIKLGYF